MAVLGLLFPLRPAFSADIPSVRAVAQSAAILVADDRIVVHEAWARASAGAATTGAAYVSLMGGTQPDSLVGASTPVAASALVHTTVNDNGILKMRPVTVIPVPPGQMVTFAPGGTHIMLMGLTQPLKAGDSFPLTLTFARAPPVTVDVRVRGLGQGAPAGDHGHGRN